MCCSMSAESRRDGENTRFFSGALSSTASVSCSSASSSSSEDNTVVMTRDVLTLETLRGELWVGRKQGN